MFVVQMQAGGNFARVTKRGSWEWVRDADEATLFEDVADLLHAAAKRGKVQGVHAFPPTCGYNLRLVDVVEARYLGDVALG